jgi:CTP synthase
VHESLCRRLSLPVRECDMKAWDLMIGHIRRPKDTVTIAMVGKYIDHQDAYKSVTESIDHAAYSHLLKANIVRLESESLEKDDNWQEKLKGVDGILVPGGFGRRGFEGKLRAIRFARENGVPYLGLCLGMQAASIEFARNVLGLSEANSTEMNEKTPHPLIVVMDSQREIVAAGALGGTMRLGSYPCTLTKKSSRTAKLYGGVDVVNERHRHRYEFNNAYRAQFEAAGHAVHRALHPRSGAAGILAGRDHRAQGPPFFIATQAHPEFKSSPVDPHPLFRGFLGAAYKHRTKVGSDTEINLTAVGAEG